MLARDSREHAWWILDFLEARPRLRRTLVIGLPLLVVALGLGFWGYRHWARTNAIRITRQWLDAGRLDQAGNALQEAIADEPDLPETWRLASELAWRKGNRKASVDFAKKAAEAGRYRADDVLAWAEASVLSDDTGQASKALSRLDAQTARGSARAQRVAGDIARRKGSFAEASRAFEAALEADRRSGARSLAQDEIPLGIVCLQTADASARARGRALLSAWAADDAWGVDALRALLADALARRDREASVRWAEALRHHPRWTLGDVPVCLQALAGADEARYHAMLTPLEDKGRSSPTEAAQLMGWLTQIGQAEEALRWGSSLDAAMAAKPPVAQGLAEARRATGRWADLQTQVEREDWGKDLGFIEWAYGMLAARHLGEDAKAETLWQALKGDASLNAAHAMFAGDSLYAWGRPKEAAELFWAAAERPDLAYLALGSLARLYQVQRDDEGQYRAFARLHEMRPSDRDLSNNYALFAALTDLGGQRRVEQLAEDTFNQEPGNVAYRCTYAFVLVWTGQASRALSLMEPVSQDWTRSRPVAFAYGAALAGVGRKDEARRVFETLDPRELEPKAVDWIRSALR